MTRRDRTRAIDGEPVVRTASLPMYDLPLLRQATDAWWSGLARHCEAAGLDGVPTDLTRPDDLMDHWTAPNLLLSQTCGYPLTHALAGMVQIVATPCYDAPGCRGAEYSSLVLVAAESEAADLSDLRGKRCAVNCYTSQSGCNALRPLVAPLARDGRFFGEVVVSGGHGNSVAMIARGEADVAAVDCVTHTLLAAHAADTLAGTRVLCRTPAAPGLPYVTAAATGMESLQRLRDAVQAAVRDPDLAAARDRLLIAGAEVLPENAYAPILEMEQRAAPSGVLQPA